jgi:hypothetical protein
VLLVIFGAGASFDSVPHLLPGSDSFADVDRPPLANQLFGDRPKFVKAMEQFPECMDLVPLLRNSTIPVEKMLARFQEQAEKYPRRHRQLAAIRYYLRYMLFHCQSHWKREWHHGITTYRTFMDEIERWRNKQSEPVCFVTFNYDTMLEDAMEETVTFPVTDMRSYVNRSDYVLVKLHGSINWGREVDGITSGSWSVKEMIENANVLNISKRFVLVKTPNLLVENGHYVFPALTIPVEKKDEFSCPQDHIQTLNDCLDRITKIIVVGWRGMDLEFILSMQKMIVHRPDLLVVSGNSTEGAETARHIGSYVSLKQNIPPVIISEGFSGLIRNQMERLEVFLSQ